MPSMLKRTGVSAYTAILAVKAETNWKSNALLVRFVEKDGLSTVFVLTVAAAKQIRVCVRVLADLRDADCGQMCENQ